MFYFVSTPIGNLKDITLRALETLKSVDVIACEDTRTSLKLLNHYEIKKPLVAYHKFNEKTSAEGLIALHEQGKDVAIITDAGTPVISDPGNVLTQILSERKIPFTVVPGATAFAPALILSGLDASKFTFLGFLPDKKRDAVSLLERYKNLDTTLLFYSAPHDLKKNLELLFSTLGDRRAVTVKEITKIHEKAVAFNLSEMVTEEVPKGEYVIVVEGQKEETRDYSLFTIEEHIKKYLSAGTDKKEAIKAVAKERGIAKSEVYKIALKIEAEN